MKGKVLLPNSNPRHRRWVKKREAVRILLRDPVWRRRSDRWCASHLGVDPKTVAKVRRSLRDSGKPPIGEADFETLACRELEKQGIPYRRQVRCPVGVADIVDPKFVYELKVQPDRNNIYCAVGQAILYAQTLKRKPCVVFDCDIEEDLYDAVVAAGVHLVVLEP
jgi:hypothetical protein